ncbi:hypothetical protein EEL31_23665 [Brevibacillus laterosporus]|nr:hypothetical protein [Brevibacillus laterosporus]TPG71132.1 hypothetical protein EEL31_23665 [Brevibacillus laterosporus]
MKKVLFTCMLVFFFSFCFVMGTPSESQACSCAMPPSVGEAKNDSTAVFMGRALGVKVQNHLITLSGPIMSRQASEDSTALGQGIEATEQVDLSKELPESNTLELKVMIVVWAVMRSMAGLLAYVW